MATIRESFKIRCPYCEGHGVNIAPQCCGEFEIVCYDEGDTRKECCNHYIPIGAKCWDCNGTGLMYLDFEVNPEWLFPEIMQKEFML